MNTQDAAAELHRARMDRTPVPTLTSRWPTMSLEEAYASQEAGINLRQADGERLIGGKLGFTSAAMRQAMGVDSPNYGWLTDAMVLDSPQVEVTDLIHPKVEPEIALVLDVPVTGPVSPDVIRQATRSVMACLEIVDSRFVDFRFAPLDNIADNSSAGKVIFGPEILSGDIDLRLCGVVVETGDATSTTVHATAAGAAAHDDPAAAVAWLVNHCGRTLPAGSVVISGGLTAPVDLTPGTTVSATFDRLGLVSLTAV